MNLENNGNSISSTKTRLCSCKNCFTIARTTPASNTIQAPPWVSKNQVTFNHGVYVVTATVTPYFFPAAERPTGPEQLLLIPEPTDKDKERIIARTRKLVEEDLGQVTQSLGGLTALAKRGIISREIEYHRLRHVRRKENEKLPQNYNHRDYYVADSSIGDLESARIGLFQILNWVSAKPGGPPKSLEKLTKFSSKIEQTPGKSPAWVLRGFTLSSALNGCIEIYSQNDQLRQVLEMIN